MTIHKIKVNLAAFGNDNTPNGEHPVILDGIPLNCQRILIQAAVNETTEVVLTLGLCEIEGLVEVDHINHLPEPVIQIGFAPKIPSNEIGSLIQENVVNELTKQKRPDRFFPERNQDIR